MILQLICWCCSGYAVSQSKKGHVFVPLGTLFLYYLANSSYFIQKKWSYKDLNRHPSTSFMLQSSNCTTTLVYNIVYFLILFNIYSTNIWHPREINSRSATACGVHVCVEYVKIGLGSKTAKRRQYLKYFSRPIHFLCALFFSFKIPFGLKPI